MPDHVVIATLDGGSAPFRVAATERGIVAAEWQADETAFIAELMARLKAHIVALDEAPANDEAAAVLRAAIPVLEARLRGERAAEDAIPTDLTDRPSWDQRR
jgi:hypothetical protein